MGDAGERAPQPQRVAGAVEQLAQPTGVSRRGVRQFFGARAVVMVIENLEAVSAQAHEHALGLIEHDHLSFKLPLSAPCIERHCGDALPRQVRSWPMQFQPFDGNRQTFILWHQ
jgi:hypothetical protein